MFSVRTVLGFFNNIADLLAFTFFVNKIIIFKKKKKRAGNFYICITRETGLAKLCENTKH